MSIKVTAFILLLMIGGNVIILSGDVASTSEIAASFFATGFVLCGLFHDVLDWWFNHD